MAPCWLAEAPPLPPQLWQPLEHARPAADRSAGLVEGRRRVTAATNKVESFKRFSQRIGFGDRGAIADNDPIEQERAMSSTRCSRTR